MNASTNDKVAVERFNRDLEERCLRQVDSMAPSMGYDPRALALARTKIQEAFMWLNRAVSPPPRVLLPEDPSGAAK